MLLQGLYMLQCSNLVAGGVRGWVTLRLNFRLKGYVSRMDR